MAGLVTSVEEGLKIGVIERHLGTGISVNYIRLVSRIADISKYKVP